MQHPIVFDIVLAQLPSLGLVAAFEGTKHCEDPQYGNTTVWDLALGLVL